MLNECLFAVSYFRIFIVNTCDIIILFWEDEEYQIKYPNPVLKPPLIESNLANISIDVAVLLIICLVIELPKDILADGIYVSIIRFTRSTKASNPSRRARDEGYHLTKLKQHPFV